MEDSPKAIKRYPSLFARILIVGFSCVLTVSLIPAILNLSFKQTIYQVNFYKKILDHSDFYDQVPILITDTFMSISTSSMQNNLLVGLDRTQFEWLIRAMIPSGWVESQTDAAMVSLLDFLNFKTETLNISVDLQPIKDHLLSEDGKQALKNLLANLPDCNEDQLTQIMIAMQSGQGGFAMCHPPSIDLFNMDTILDPVINSYASSLPSKIEIAANNQQGVISKLIESPIFRVYKIIRQYLELFQWICLILALIIILLSLRSMHWMATSLGIPLILASSVLVIPGVWLFLTGGQGLNGISESASFSSLDGFEGIMNAMIQEGFRRAGQGLLIWCVGTLAIGLVFISIRLVTRK